MKGLIPAAGMGTRLHPVTLAIPKELLLVGDKAIIEYVIEAMKKVGIVDITIVVGWKKHAILDYLGSGKRLGVRITYVVQDERDGLGKAVLAGQHVIGDESFLVVLGDDFFYPTSFLEDILRKHESSDAVATVGVAEVEDVSRHGIIKPGEGNVIVDMIEKPSVEDAPSKLGAMGVYVFDAGIFDAIRRTKPGHKGEIQLTDAISGFIREGKKVCFETISGHHIDVGTLEDLKKANLFMSEVVES